MPLSRTSPALSYSTFGSPFAPAVIFVNGLGGHKESWMHQVRALAPTRCVVTYNQRGVGGSEVLDQDTRVADFARDLFALMDDLDLATADLVGISFGGRVLQEAALVGPHRVRHLVLVSTSGGFPADDPGDLRAREALRRAASLTVQEWRTEVIPSLFGRTFLESHARQVHALARYWSERPQVPAGLARQWQAYDTFDRYRDLHEISLPTTVIHGDEDLLVPVVNGERLARAIPGARFHLIRGAGHSPNVEEPAAFNEALVGALSSGPAPGAQPSGL